MRNAVTFLVLLVLLALSVPVHAQNGVVVEVWEGTTKLTSRPVDLVNGHTYKFKVVNTIQAKSYGSLDMHSVNGIDAWSSESWGHDVEPGTTCTTSGLVHTCSGGPNTVTAIWFIGTYSSGSDTTRGRIGDSTQWDSAAYN